jgi:hypothetical protein
VKAVEKAFTVYMDREPNDKERQRLMRGRDAVGIKDNDALWTLLMVLEHYETLYERFPALIAKAASDVTDNARAAAESELKAAAARTRAELAKSVAETARDIASRAASVNRLQWIVSCVVCVCILLGGFIAVSYGVGKKMGDSAGHDRALAESRDEKAAADWANTPEGRLAHGLADAGSVRSLATCSGRGWKPKEGACVPKCERGSVDGWSIPASGGR